MREKQKTKNRELKDRSIESSQIESQREKNEKTRTGPSKCGRISKDENTHNWNTRRRRWVKGSRRNIWCINAWEHDKLLIDTKPELRDIQKTSYWINTKQNKTKTTKLHWSISYSAVGNLRQSKRMWKQPEKKMSLTHAGERKRIAMVISSKNTSLKKVYKV